MKKIVTISLAAAIVLGSSQTFARRDDAGAAVDKAKGRGRDAGAKIAEVEEDAEVAVNDTRNVGKQKAEQARRKAEEAGGMAGEERGKKEREQTRREGKAKEQGAQAADRGEKEVGKSLENIAQAREKAEEKHLKRVAKLEAIREKMQEKGNDEAALRIEAALEKENTRYQREIENIDRRVAAVKPEKNKAADKNRNKDKGQDNGETELVEVEDEAQDVD